MNETIKVAIPALGSVYWTGGLTYQINLLTALQHYAPFVKVYLLVQNASNLHSLSCQQLVIPEPKRLMRLVYEKTKRYLAYDLQAKWVLQAVPDGVDVLFAGDSTVGGKTAFVPWIPDFQHMQMPEMFPEGEVRIRNIGFKQAIERADLVALSSCDAQNDFRAFAPEAITKTRVLNFVAAVSSQIYEIDPNSVVVEYHLPEKFFYLPNQIWKHKNHLVVFEALKILRDKGIKPFLVMTGNTSDYRNPTYFSEVLHQISLWGLRDQLAFLGLVPHEHVHLLIRQAVAVVNPSLFEGWSTTVEEVKSVGKRIILSNLKVHLEQNPPLATFFDPRNPEDVANKLAEVWQNVDPGADRTLEDQARKELPFRMQKYADTFVTILREAVDLRQKK